ncbi:hypothetical protein ACN47E_002454 [Coniothyrium glycines]
MQGPYSAVLTPTPTPTDTHRHFFPHTSSLDSTHIPGYHTPWRIHPARRGRGAAQPTNPFLTFYSAISPWFCIAVCVYEYEYEDEASRDVAGAGSQIATGKVAWTAGVD